MLLSNFADRVDDVVSGHMSTAGEVRLGMGHIHKNESTLKALNKVERDDQLQVFNNGLMYIQSSLVKRTLC